MSVQSVLSAISSIPSDLVIVRASIGSFSILNTPELLALLDQLYCPVIVARDFLILGVYRAKSLILREFGK